MDAMLDGLLARRALWPGSPGSRPLTWKRQLLVHGLCFYKKLFTKGHKTPISVLGAVARGQDISAGVETVESARQRARREASPNTQMPTREARVPLWVIVSTREKK